MAVTFDGPNLIITLESGVTEIEWQDVYSDWKRWVNDGGGDPYPPAFRPDGGSPLTAIIDQGRYYFLRNDLGWRIKPPEEDITILAAGNLALEDSSLPSILPTTGAFTAAILGLQPITQGVVPSMKTNLEFNTYQGAVCIDMANVTGNAVAGTGYSGESRIGTRTAPSNNPDDALAIALREGLNTFQIVSDFDGVAYNTDFSLGYRFVGDAPYIDFDMTNTLSLDNCVISNLRVGGEADGNNVLDNCRILNITGFNGTVKNCEVDGSIALNGSIVLRDNSSARTGLGYSTLTNIGTFDVQVRNMVGSLGLVGMTGGTHSVGISEGRLVIEATCTGGTIHARGIPYEITDLGTATVVDQTDSEKVSNLTTGGGATADEVLVQAIIANKITG